MSRSPHKTAPSALGPRCPHRPRCQAARQRATCCAEGTAVRLLRTRLPRAWREIQRWSLTARLEPAASPIATSRRTAVGEPEADDQRIIPRAIQRGRLIFELSGSAYWLRRPEKGGSTATSAQRARKQVRQRTFCACSPACLWQRGAPVLGSKGAGPAKQGGVIILPRFPV